MKLTIAHQEKLKELIDDRVSYIRAKQWSDDLTPFFEAYRKKGGDWEKRFMWDMLYSAPYKLREQWFDEVYEYANDDHIYTVLKRVMKDYMP